LGFSNPKIDLPERYKFISMHPQQISIDSWANDIYNVMINDPNEFIIFMLDDFLPLDYLNSDILELYYSEMQKDKNIPYYPRGIYLLLKLEKIPPKNNTVNKEILFFGYLSERRINLINILKKNGFNVKIVDGCFGEKLFNVLK